MTAKVHAQLDHIVILIPIEQLRSLPTWLTDNFTISPGGKHADGRTENVLILLADGVYLEIIAFTEHTSPEDRAKHRWGKLQYGIIDYAFTLTTDDVDGDFEALKQCWSKAGVDEKLVPEKLVDGGRTRPDGEELRWRIATPFDAIKTGVANFWCLDVTPRRLRVPLSETATRHPSGVTGLKEVTIDVKVEDVRDLGTLFGSYLKGHGKDSFSIDTPVAANGAEGSAIKVREAEDGDRGIFLHLHTTGPAKTVRGDVGGNPVILHIG